MINVDGLVKGKRLSTGITHVEVEPAHNSDANALISAIERAEDRGLKPEVLIADSLYGSEDNTQNAKEHGGQASKRLCRNTTDAPG